MTSQGHPTTGAGVALSPVSGLSATSPHTAWPPSPKRWDRARHTLPLPAPSCEPGARSPGKDGAPPWADLRALHARGPQLDTETLPGAGRAGAASCLLERGLSSGGDRTPWSGGTPGPLAEAGRSHLPRSRRTWRLGCPLPHRLWGTQGHQDMATGGPLPPGPAGQTARAVPEGPGPLRACRGLWGPPCLQTRPGHGTLAAPRSPALGHAPEAVTDRRAQPTLHGPLPGRGMGSDEGSCSSARDTVAIVLCPPCYCAEASPKIILDFRSELEGAHLVTLGRRHFPLQAPGTSEPTPGSEDAVSLPGVGPTRSPGSPELLPGEQLRVFLVSLLDSRAPAALFRAPGGAWSPGPKRPEQRRLVTSCVSAHGGTPGTRDGWCTVGGHSVLGTGSGPKNALMAACSLGLR